MTAADMTPAEWLEQQAADLAGRLAVEGGAASTVPAYLAYPGAEQPQPLRLTRSTVPVTGGVAHAALDDLARTVQRNHSGEATP